MYYVIVAGSRSFNDYTLLAAKLDKVLVNKMPDVVIVSGGARGADTLAIEYAQRHGLKCDVMPADWNRHGKRAGFMRNADMANHADALVAFWDGQSRGTAHMVRLMQQKGKPVRVVRFSNGTGG